MDRRLWAYKRNILFIIVILIYIIETTAIKEVKRPPSIIRQPNKEIIFRSDYEDDLKLYCEATGNPAPIYYWTINSELLHTGGDYEGFGNEGSIRIKHPQKRNEGYYMCKASNKYGTALSNMIHLRQARNIAFPIKQQADQDATLDGSKTLYCNPPPRSVTAPRYVWARKETGNDAYLPLSTDNNDGRISIDGQGNLQFSYVKESDEAIGRYKYTCGIMNEIFGSVNYGTPTTLRVIKGDNSGMNHIPKELWTSMDGVPNAEDSVVVLRGQNITLQCIFSGKPVPHVMWSKKSGSLPEKRHMFQRGDVNQQKLTILHATYSDSGSYKCTGLSHEGRLSQHIKLKVEASPYWADKSPEDIFETEGQTALFRCTALGKPEPKVEFFINGKRVADMKPNARRFIYGDSIIFTKLNKSDLQVIQCNVSNKHGYIFADAFLNVIQKTVMTLSPQSVFLGKTLTIVKFVCDGTTDPSTEKIIRWYIDNKLIHNNTENLELSNDLRMLTVNTKKAEKYVGREYKCVIDNGYNSTATGKAFLHYTARPQGPGAVTEHKASSWWAGIIVGFVVALLLIVTVLYVMYRKKMGTYSVDKKERKAGLFPARELSRSLFRAYSRQDLEPIRGKRASIIELGSASTLYGDSIADSDDDSVGGFSDINTEKFQEDGSFLGKYNNRKKNKYDTYDNPELQKEIPVTNGYLNKHNYENIENCQVNIHSVL